MISNTTMWNYPPLSLLIDSKPNDKPLNPTAIIKIIQNVLDEFKVDAKIVKHIVSYQYTKLFVSLGKSVHTSKIETLKFEFARALSSRTGSVDIIPCEPGTPYVSIVVPHTTPMHITLKELFESNAMKNVMDNLSMPLGMSAINNPFLTPIKTLPHILIVGQSDAELSAYINTLFISLLMMSSPNQIQLLMMDASDTVFYQYDGIPNLLTPVIYEYDNMLSSLRWLIKEMDGRYNTFSQSGVNNIDEYNSLFKNSPMPYVVVLFHEYSKAEQGSYIEITNALRELLLESESAGIRIILTSSQPSDTICTGRLFETIPAKIVFRIPTSQDSRNLINTNDAELLYGHGDCLYKESAETFPIRFQTPVITEKEIQAVIDYIKTHNRSFITLDQRKRDDTNNEDTVVFKDELLDEAITIACNYGKVGASLLQRKLSIEYERAEKLIDHMEKLRIIGPAEGAKPRDVLIHDPSEYQKKTI